MAPLLEEINIHQWGKKIGNDTYKRGLIPSDLKYELESGEKQNGIEGEVNRLRNSVGEYSGQINSDSEDTAT